MAIKKGFSLIELTVVVGLLSILILAISSTMLMSVISSNRIRTTTKIKQAGNFALDKIQSMLRSAKSIVSCDSENFTISIINPDGGETLIANELISEVDEVQISRIASNSATFLTEYDLASKSGVYLTPSSVDTTSFQITCEPNDISPNLVKVSFDLKDIYVTKAIENPLLHFETSINLRNE